MTPAPISVETLSALREAAITDNSTTVVRSSTLLALLHQLAELESDRDEWKRRESFAVSDLQRELRERDAKLAERDAEVERLTRDRDVSEALYREAERAREEADKLLREAYRWLFGDLCDGPRADEGAIENGYYTNEFADFHARIAPFAASARPANCSCKVSVGLASFHEDDCRSIAAYLAANGGDRA